MQLNKKLSALFVTCLLCAVSISNAYANVPNEWVVWLGNLKNEMISRGISPKTIEKAYGDNLYYHQKPEVVEKDNTQTEFVLTSVEYVNRLANENRINKVRKHYKNFQKKYQKLEEEYEVPLNYLTAFWAIETNFGQNKGKYHLIDGLTNLSYKNRRAKFLKTNCIMF